ncbi:MAG: 16S rRNA (cytosine(967)-C(5))-methyltransferase RsmB [Proteobacteria bacterium]|nr:16S rRNA (cytosine(967)-C(5))-methyltransferase RsmB [Pseudomonadota bacterium]
MAKTPWAPGAPALAAAARAVDAVAFRGESVDAALATAEDMDERAAVRAIALGTVRWYLRLAPAIESLLERPRGVPSPVRALLAAAAHQIEYSRNAPELTAHLAVDAARLLGAERSTGLVNAVLRRFVAERATRLGRVDATLPGRTAHPGWLVKEIARAWGERAVAVLEANNLHPPMTLRLDLSRTGAAEYRAALAERGIASQEAQWMASALTLDRPVAVSELPGFPEGRVSVQDAGAQLAAGLMDLAPGQRVLDGCAAPGGKSGALLERCPQIQLTCADLSAERVALIAENLARLQRPATLVATDLRDPAAFSGEPPFDRILVDAPCSSTGVIRRHPDIKLLRRPGDIPAFAAEQLQILRTAAARLAPGGRLVYCTCSVLPAENEAVIERLLEREPGLSVAPMPPAAALAPGAVGRAIGVQLLPGGQAGTDGFYYACLEKTTAGS